MQAIRVHHFGGLDSLVAEDVPRPAPGDGEVLLRESSRRRPMGRMDLVTDDENEVSDVFLHDLTHRRHRPSAGARRAKRRIARAAARRFRQMVSTWPSAAVVADLETKRQDCLSSPDRAFGEVKISVRTLLDDGTERRGLRIRHIERFYWDLLATMPTLANQWKELAATTAVVGEPLTAGDYMIVARSADGKDLSEARQISVRRNGTTQFDVPLR